MKIDESLLLARQGEELAERQLRHREVSVGRKPMAIGFFHQTLLSRGTDLDRRIKLVSGTGC